jgi:dTDP-D-glucose 4,6-dehydratase
MQVWNSGYGIARHQRSRLYRLRLLDFVAAKLCVDRSISALAEFMVQDGNEHDLRYAIDDSRIRDEPGYRPLTSLEQGLANAIA